MSREMLENKTTKELREIGKELNISGRWDMKKSELIEAILRVKAVGDQNEISTKDEHKVDNQVSEVEEKVEKESTDIIDENKLSYIEKAVPGTIVAFRLPEGKVKSAKIAKKSSKNRRFKLETSYGAEYIVSYDDIVWVKTNKRWPRGVYNLLRGATNEEESIRR